jgi:hypothetical protein
MMLCSMVETYQDFGSYEDGGNIHFRNVGKFLPVYMASIPIIFHIHHSNKLKY